MPPRTLLCVLSLTLLGSVAAADERAPLDHLIEAQTALEDARVYYDEFRHNERELEEPLLETVRDFRRGLARAKAVTDALPAGEARTELTETRNLIAIRASFLKQYKDAPWVPWDREGHRLLKTSDAKHYVDLTGLSREDRAVLRNAIRRVWELYWWNPPDRTKRYSDGKELAHLHTVRIHRTRNALLNLLDRPPLRVYFFALDGPFSEKVQWLKDRTIVDTDGHVHAFVGKGSRITTKTVHERDRARLRRLEQERLETSGEPVTLPGAAGLSGRLSGETSGSLRRYGGTLKGGDRSIRILTVTFDVPPEQVWEGLTLTRLEIVIKTPDPGGEVVYEAVHEPPVATTSYTVNWVRRRSLPGNVFYCTYTLYLSDGQAIERTRRLLYGFH